METEQYYFSIQMQLFIDVMVISIIIFTPFYYFLVLLCIAAHKKNSHYIYYILWTHNVYFMLLNESSLCVHSVLTTQVNIM